MKLALVHTLFILSILAIPVLSAAPPQSHPLFEAGRGGYACYRIPGLVITPKGTLLAFCEARKNSQSDWGGIDILMRRSEDGGNTWLPPVNLTLDAPRVEKNKAALRQNLAKEEEPTYNNPVLISDRVTGAVHFLFCAEYARCFYSTSGDEGRTFSPPVDITASFEGLKTTYPWSVIATGPGHGIQLTNGRLLVPVWLSTGTGGHAHRPSCVSTLYSDDHGATWRLGEIIAKDPDPLNNPSESVAVELTDGRVMLNIRNESKIHRRAVSYSPDGATGWTRPEFDRHLFEPICMASLLRLPSQPGWEKDTLLFANPDNKMEGKENGNLRARQNLTLKCSFDEGNTWSLERTLDPGLSGYSDLAATPDGRIICFYEKSSPGASVNPQGLYWAPILRDWLMEKPAKAER